jgi:hypothetical protein
MSISRSIAGAHGGRQWAESNDGHGAPFRFTLPTNKGGSHKAGSKIGQGDRFNGLLSSMITIQSANRLWAEKLGADR